MTGQDVVTGALRLIGAVPAGESPSSEESTDGLAVLNRMLDSWSTQRLMVYTVPRETFSLVAGTQTYTMGSGGTLNTARPLKIESAVLVVTNVTPNIDRPIQLVNKDEWVAIAQKSFQSQIPLFLYNDDAYPLASLSLWPVPNDSTYQLGLYSWKVLTQVASLSTALSFPPGYERAIVTNLGIELSPEYSKMPSEILLAMAEDAKGNVKRLNADKFHLLRCDPALQSSPSRFNIYTGEFR